MDGPAGIILAIIGAIGGLAGLAALFRIRAQNNADDATARKADAEVASIHVKVADRWAEHVDELMSKVSSLDDLQEKAKKEIMGLRMDIAQVRRENEEYRQQLVERDEIIVELKDWATRLVRQVEVHAPGVVPEKFIQRRKV